MKGGAVFLHDVTSSYLEGEQDELAAPGYDRDGKRYKKRIVAGLRTDVVLVGDRGTIEAEGRKLPAARGFRYITSLTDPEIRAHADPVEARDGRDPGALADGVGQLPGGRRGRPPAGRLQTGPCGRRTSLAGSCHATAEHTS